MIVVPTDPSAPRRARRGPISARCRLALHAQSSSARPRRAECAGDRTTRPGRPVCVYHSSTPLPIRAAANSATRTSVVEKTPKQQNTIRRVQAPAGTRPLFRIAMTSSPGFDAIMQHFRDNLQFLLVISGGGNAKPVPVPIGGVVNACLMPGESGIAPDQGGAAIISPCARESRGPVPRPAAARIVPCPNAFEFLALYQTVRPG